jgi:uncharacterized repeat protein (TIGR03803 family)
MGTVPIAAGQNAGVLNTASYAQAPPRSQPPRNATTYKSLYSFKGGADGRLPIAGLLDVNGTLYGTTNGLGTNNGSVFKITTSGKETVLHSFTGGSDGYGPLAGLIYVNGALYGTTEGGGGSSNGGTVFKITLSGRKTVIYDFLGGVNDGAGPTGNLLSVNGSLYGTTVGDGAGGCGVVFEVTPSSTVTERVLHSFMGSPDGCEPFNAGVIDVGGTLYGTTYVGGFRGTVFKLSRSGTESVLYTFKGVPDGSAPSASLIAVNGTVYGTTLYGGANNVGTVFAIATSGTESVLHSFGSGSDGIEPSAALLAVNGTLYGTTALGGANGHGTAFRITPSGTESILYSFMGGTDGEVPTGGLIAIGGTLYGTTEVGGTSGNGTVFSLAL